jgi:PAS domain S-box-containing protein
VTGSERATAAALSAVDPPATVLVVEDDPGVMRLQQLGLQRAGYNVRVASTAEEALKVVREDGIDLMLLDHNLPGSVTGLELYQKVKDAGYDIPAILVTGFAGESIVLQSFRAGVYDFVPKSPDYMEYLLPTIERVLNKRRTECQLVESEARLASIFDSALDAVLTVDSQQRIGMFNPAAEQIFGTSARDAKGRPVQDFLPEWDNGGARATRPPGNGEAPKPGAQTERWETEGARADGRRFPVELSASWVEANRKGFWTCVARDISERRRAQKERERLISEQAARKQAEAAKAEILATMKENNRLYQELRQVDRLKDEFLAMLAHELRNPLAPIRNALELIRLEAPHQPPAARENWGIIERQVTHLVRLVDDLLDVSRISQGKIVLQKEPLELSTVVARALESSQPLIQARRHTLSVRVSPDPMPVEGDLVRLVQVLSNLLNNAAKYTAEGGRVELIAEREGEEVVLRVRDTGVGIAPEMLPHLFTLFTQSERTLDRSEGGLGIGLTLVRRLTEMHKGRVEARSAGLGKGSEFIVRLPLAKSAPPPEEGTASAKVEAPAGARRRVLVVDDLQDSARTMGRLLTVMGHDVRTAHEGHTALELAASFRPEIVLLDIGLPGMDGYEVGRQLRARESASWQPVLIALTGYGAPEDRQLSQAAGFNAHLVKPVDLEALKHLLAQPLELLKKGGGEK